MGQLSSRTLRLNTLDPRLSFDDVLLDHRLRWVSVMEVTVSLIGHHIARDLINDWGGWSLLWIHMTLIWLGGTVVHWHLSLSLPLGDIWFQARYPRRLQTFNPIFFHITSVRLPSRGQFGLSDYRLLSPGCQLTALLWVNWIKFARSNSHIFCQPTWS